MPRCLALPIFVLAALANFAFAANPIPLINQPLFPSAVAPGGSGFSLTVTGTGFTSGAVVNWNGSPRTTTFVSSAKLQASVLATDIATASTASITVSNPGPGGGISNTVFFQVSKPTAVSFSLSSILFGVSPSVVAVGDVNGDRKMDIAVLDSKCTQNGCAPSGSVFILLGKGDGTFSIPLEFPAGYFPLAMVLADFNADGRPDIAVAHSDCTTIPCKGEAAVLLGNGDGTFQSLVDYQVDADPRSILAADMDGDGRLDVVTADSFNKIAVLRGKGNGTFRNRRLAQSKTYPGSMVVGDFNGDGLLDLAVTDFCAFKSCGPDAVSVLLAMGDGRFQRPIRSHAQDVGIALAAADLNSDGILDLAFSGCPGGSCVGGLLTVLVGTGSGFFSQGNNYSAPEYFWRIAMGDFNSEGNLDLAAISASSLSLFFGDGSGGFQWTGGFGVGTNPHWLATGDFNGDGRLDFVSNEDGGISVLLQN